MLHTVSSVVGPAGPCAAAFERDAAAVSIVSLAAAHTVADDLWRGAVASGSPWSTRKASIAQLHTLCYQLLAEITWPDVAIETGGAR